MNEMKKLTVNEGIQSEKVDACRSCIELPDSKQEANTIESQREARTAQTQMQSTTS
jgi:hypothetical protein